MRSVGVGPVSVRLLPNSRFARLPMSRSSLQHYYTEPPQLTRPWKEDVRGGGGARAKMEVTFSGAPSLSPTGSYRPRHQVGEEHHGLRNGAMLLAL